MTIHMGLPLRGCRLRSHQIWEAPSCHPSNSISLGSRDNLNNYMSNVTQDRCLRYLIFGTVPHQTQMRLALRDMSTSSRLCSRPIAIGSPRGHYLLQPPTMKTSPNETSIRQPQSRNRTGTLDILVSCLPCTRKTWPIGTLQDREATLLFRTQNLPLILGNPSRIVAVFRGHCQSVEVIKFSIRTYGIERRREQVHQIVICAVIRGMSVLRRKIWLK
jgi:hypothetical protein